MSFSKQPMAYKHFLIEMRKFVESRGVNWNIPMSGSGVVRQKDDWDLRYLTGGYSAVAARLNGFSVEIAALDIARSAGWSTHGIEAGTALPKHVREFIKAAIACWSQSGFSTRGIRDNAKTLKRIFSTTSIPPWELSSEDLDRFVELFNEQNTHIGTSVQTIATLVNSNLLSTRVPLKVSVGRAPPKERMLGRLLDREAANKLPARRPLYEFVRIIYHEAPRSHHDAMAFFIGQVLLLSGLRPREVRLLPEQCLISEQVLDIATGKPADEAGGVSRTLRLRYFAAKDSDAPPDALHEKTQPVPACFIDLVEAAVVAARAATAELRALLRSQYADRSFDRKLRLPEYKTTGGQRVTEADFLFLVVQGGLCEPGMADMMTQVSVYGESTLNAAFGGDNRSNLFKRYGKTEETRALSILPKAFRHLQNTELFRLGVPDTAITHRFGRKSVAESYEYDHRTLDEKLKGITLPETASVSIPSGSSQERVAKLILGGLAGGSRIENLFFKVRSEHGEAAAFRVLASQADGFHATPYGLCINSFAINPCPHHLKCFHGCGRFIRSGSKEHTISLTELKGMLRMQREAAMAKPVKTIGRKNQIEHVSSLLRGVEAALATAPDQPVFESGPDFSVAEMDVLE